MKQTKIFAIDEVALDHAAAQMYLDDADPRDPNHQRWEVATDEIKKPWLWQARRIIEAYLNACAGF